jgi:hypothetical protein
MALERQIFAIPTIGGRAIGVTVVARFNTERQYAAASGDDLTETYLLRKLI